MYYGKRDYYSLQPFDFLSGDRLGFIESFVPCRWRNTPPIFPPNRIGIRNVNDARQHWYEFRPKFTNIFCYLRKEIIWLFLAKKARPLSFNAEKYVPATHIPQHWWYRCRFQQGDNASNLGEKMLKGNNFVHHLQSES